jgi:hypothetical protein
VVVVVVPAEAGADLVEDGDGSVRIGGGAVVVFAAVTVVGPALEFPVGLAGDPTVSDRHDVVDGDVSVDGECESSWGVC